MFDGGSGHQPQFLNGITNVSFQQSLEAIAPSHNFSGFLILFCYFDSDVLLLVTAAMSVGTPETIFKLDTLIMIVAKIGSNMFSGFREDFF